jgi:hypothetical protein
MTQTRIVYSDVGDRWDAWMSGEDDPGPDTLSLRRHKHKRHAYKSLPLGDGDWSWAVTSGGGRTVNSGVALFDPLAGWTATSVSCAARLVVPVDGNTAGNRRNLWVFDNLVRTGSNGACVNTSDGNCSPSADGHCPRPVASLVLSGTVQRSGVTLSLDGGTAYVATTSGTLYAINVAAATPAIKWSYAVSGGTYAGIMPWVDYATGNVIAAVAVSSGTTVMKFRPTDTAPWQTFALSEKASATPVDYGGYIYVPCASGKIHRVKDTATGLVGADTGAWPVQLRATTGSADANRDGIPEPDQAAAILANVGIDASVDVLFAVVKNTMWSVRLSDGHADYVEMGWQNRAEAAANNVEAYSAPSINWGATRAVFLGHGKAQPDGSTPSSRLHRRFYDASGNIDKVNLSSVALYGQTSSDLTRPHSSAIGIPINAQGDVYAFIGDGGGYLNKFAFTGELATTPTTFSSGSEIESPVLVDYMGGNIYFGNDSGRVYQISQSTLK